MFSKALHFLRAILVEKSVRKEVLRIHFYRLLFDRATGFVQTAFFCLPWIRIKGELYVGNETNPRVFQRGIPSAQT